MKNPTLPVECWLYSPVVKVTVVLSTYNGQRFLIPQLESILNQQSVQIRLLIRDDGSIDDSKKILADFSEKHPNISVSYGRNVGVVTSYMLLLEQLSPQVDFIAFADQDDIWRPNKLSLAIEQMQALSGAVLYCSCYSAVNEEGMLLWQSSVPPGAITFNNAVIENITTGCTVVINKPLLTLMQVAQVNTQNIIMHDWWAYLVATCFGSVIFDPKSTIFYRQHAGNVIGVKSGLSFWLARLNRFVFQPNTHSRISQAKEFLSLYQHTLSSEKTQLLTEFIGYQQGNLPTRARYALQTPVYMQKRIDNLIMKFQLIIGRVH